MGDGAVDLHGRPQTLGDGAVDLHGRPPTMGDGAVDLHGRPQTTWHLFDRGGRPSRSTAPLTTALQVKVDRSTRLRHCKTAAVDRSTSFDYAAAVWAPCRKGK